MVNRCAVPCLIAAVLAASASAAPAPQGVTALVEPPSSAPAQCSVNGIRTYGLAIHAIGGSKQKRQLVTQIADGQVQANGPAEVVPGKSLDTGITQIPDGQIQANEAPVKIIDADVIQIDDGQIQAPVTQIPDGQIQAPVTGGITQIPDGQIQAPVIGGVTQIPDGQIQAPAKICAVKAVEEAPATGFGALFSSYYYKKTVETVSEPVCGGPEIVQEVVPPVEISSSASATFEVPAEGLTTMPKVEVEGHPTVCHLRKRQVSQISDDQTQAYGAPTDTGVTQIADGQIQVNEAPADTSAPPPAGDQSQANETPTDTGAPPPTDDQSQANEAPTDTDAPPAPTDTGAPPASDDQSQAYGAPTDTGAPPAPTDTDAPPASDDQSQAYGAPTDTGAPPAPTDTGAPPASDDQSQAYGAPTDTGAPPAPTDTDAPPASDDQSQAYGAPTDTGAPPAPTDTDAPPAADDQTQAYGAPTESIGTGVTQIADGQIQANLMKRQNGVPLAVSLNGGVLTDALGRTGYIAEGRQFQFDDPPQSGAVFTGGWSVCDDGALALGEQKEFYACGSSDFNNLYDQPVFPDNCHPVTIAMV